jgi:hypothetical protein
MNLLATTDISVHLNLNNPSTKSKFVLTPCWLSEAESDIVTLASLRGFFGPLNLGSLVALQVFVIFKRKDL